MEVCRKCRREVSKYFQFCPNCGIRKPWDSVASYRNVSWSVKVKRWWARQLKEWWTDPARDPDKIFREMQPEGNERIEWELSAILRARPEDAKARSLLALAYGLRAQNEEMRRRDTEAAINTYGQAISVEGNNPKYWIGRAGTLAEVALRLRTYKEYGEVLGLGGPSVGRLDELAKTQDWRTFYEKAIEDYSMALRCDPTNVEALKGKAEVLTKLGKRDAASRDYQEALDILARALRANAVDSDSLFQHVSILEALNRKSEAFDELNRARAMPNYESSRELLDFHIRQLTDTSKA